MSRCRNTFALFLFGIFQGRGWPLGCLEDRSEHHPTNFLLHSSPGVKIFFTRHARPFGVSRRLQVLHQRPTWLPSANNGPSLLYQLRRFFLANGTLILLIVVSSTFRLFPRTRRPCRGGIARVHYSAAGRSMPRPCFFRSLFGPGKIDGRFVPATLSVARFVRHRWINFVVGRSQLLYLRRPPGFPLID